MLALQPKTLGQMRTETSLSNASAAALGLRRLCTPETIPMTGTVLRSPFIVQPVTDCSFTMEHDKNTELLITLDQMQKNIQKIVAR
jgi:hypothetical protein